MQAETPMYRRCRLSALTIAERGKSTRRGVRLKTVPNVHMAISPETCRSRSIGLAPSWLVKVGTMRRQTPTPNSMASATNLRPRNLAAKVRRVVKNRGGELCKGGVRIKNSGDRSQNSGESIGRERVNTGPEVNARWRAPSSRDLNDIKSIIS